MVFQSLQFLRFFAPVFFLNLFFVNRVADPRWRKILLVIASAIFYMSWNAPLFALLVGSISINYLVGGRIHRSADARGR